MISFCRAGGPLSSSPIPRSGCFLSFFYDGVPPPGPPRHTSALLECLIDDSNPASPCAGYPAHGSRVRREREKPLSGQRLLRFASLPSGRGSLRRRPRGAIRVACAAMACYGLIVCHAHVFIRGNLEHQTQSLLHSCFDSFCSAQEVALP